MTLAFVIVAAIVLSVIFVLLVYPRIKRHQFLKVLRKRFGHVPEVYEGLLVSESYWKSLNEKQFVGTEEYVDDLTWFDLDMDAVFHRVNACQSSIGDVVLYKSLRKTATDDVKRAEREYMIGLFEKDDSLRIEAQTILHELGRNGGSSLDITYFYANTLTVERLWLYRILAFLPLLCTPLLFINPTIAFFCILGSFVVNAGLEMYFKAKHEDKFIAVRYVAAMILCAKRLSKVLTPIDAKLSQQLNKVTIPFRKMSGSIGVLQFDEIYTKVLGMVCPLTLFLIPLLSYAKIAKRLVELHDAIGLLFEAVGETDMAAALLSYRKSLAIYTRPSFTSESIVKFTGIAHPLLERAVLNSATFSNDVLVTGSNASGKSTFLKAIAINCILAQTINTCTAQSFHLHEGKVATSMAVADSIIDGDSYFVAEIKSMRRLLQLAENGFSYFFIDEILRGTNTIERVSAASEVIAYLHDKNCLCFAATHDIELTLILIDVCHNIHFREVVEEDGVCFDYKLQEGPSTSRNAILLLDRMGFPAEIPQRATVRAKHFEQTGQWLNNSNNAQVV